MQLMNDRQKKAIIKAYHYRLMALNIDVNEDNLVTKLLPLSNDELNNSFSNVMNGNQNEIISVLRKLGIPAMDKNESLNKLKEDVKRSLNLSDITEFDNESRSYFKFKDKKGDIFVVRNLGDDSKELFTTLLNSTNITNNIDGKTNTAEIFKFLKDKKFIEIQLEKTNEIDESKQPKNQITIIKEIEKQFPDKEIVVGLKENIYIVKGNTEEEDIILSVTKENGKYTVKSLTQKTYGSKTKETDDNENVKTTTNVEVPNDFMIELENNDEIAKIIEEGLNNNLDDDQIINMANNAIETRYPNFRNIPNLHTIIMNLINNRRNNRENNSQTNSLGGRQYVLTNNNISPHLNENEEAA